MSRAGNHLAAAADELRPEGDSEVHAFRAEATGRFEGVHRDIEELRREVKEELDRTRSLVERCLAAVVVTLVVSLAALAIAIVVPI